MEKWCGTFMNKMNLLTFTIICSLLLLVSEPTEYKAHNWEVNLEQMQFSIIFRYPELQLHSNFILWKLFNTMQFNLLFTKRNTSLQQQKICTWKLKIFALLNKNSIQPAFHSEVRWLTYYKIQKILIISNIAKIQNTQILLLMR